MLPSFATSTPGNFFNKSSTTALGLVLKLPALYSIVSFLTFIGASVTTTSSNSFVLVFIKISPRSTTNLSLLIISLLWTVLYPSKLILTMNFPEEMFFTSNEPSFCDNPKASRVESWASTTVIEASLRACLPTLSISFPLTVPFWAIEAIENNINNGSMYLFSIINFCENESK